MWESTKRSEFADNIFNIQLVQDDGSVSTSAQELSQSSDESVEHQIDKDRYGDIPQYSPLFYTLRDEAMKFGVGTFQSFERSKQLQFRIAVGEGASQQIISLPLIDVYEVTSFKTSNVFG